MKIKVAIADDHPIVVEGISNLLGAQQQLEVIDTYGSGQALLEGLKKRLPDVLLLDIHFPDTTGNELLRIISPMYPKMRILAITSVNNVYNVKDMMKHGCSGYILKSAPLQVLIEAIETIHSGSEFMEPGLKEQLYQMLLKKEKSSSDSLRLTQREKLVLELLSEGKTSNEIAEQLFLSPRTIENNRFSLYQKMGVKNTAELIKAAMRQGLVE